VSTTARPARWWEKDGPLPEGRQGRLVSPAGRSGTVTCPACGNNPVVYNGNYFCDGWVFPGPARQEEGECEWALAHPATTRRDREFCDLVGLDYH
jgi:hypothetical protein